MTHLDPPRLRVRTVEVEVTGELLGLVPPDAPPHTVCSWVRERDGLVGWGSAARHRTDGHSRFRDAETWWQQLVAAAQVDDEVGLPGTGLLAFGSFAFAADSAAGGSLQVPRVLVGRHEGRAWLTTIDPIGEPAAQPDLIEQLEQPLPKTRLLPGVVPGEKWPSVIQQAMECIEAGEVDKVVLARDVLVQADDPIPLRTMLMRLARRYTATWTFAVDGLIGATPEMLVRLQQGRVRSRVLAGTVRRDHAPAPLVTEPHPDLEDPRRRLDPRLHLVSSPKELSEHAIAVRSVADALSPYCHDLQVPPEPFVLELPDVYHLATDLVGMLATGVTSVRLAEALHPSAAVCGTPTDAAARLLAELEGIDRDRYAGPVGWISAEGDGDWGIALRCGRLGPDEKSVRLFAGGGIMAASDPDAELAETELKLATMRHALDA